MQLIGQAIKHKDFGNGIITDWADNVVTICFSQGEKKFIYPDAFSDYLILRNNRIQSEIDGILNQKKKAEETKKQEIQEKEERMLSMRNLKITPVSQAVFDIKPENKEEIILSWSVSTGRYLSGHSKGQPRIPTRLKPNSVCLLTECAENKPEKERQIIGAFMVMENFWGMYCRDGMIESHPIYRIMLSPKDYLPFWPYTVNDSLTQRWNNAAFKYFSTKSMKNILYDMKETLRDPKEKEISDRFYEYFCKINQIPIIQCSINLEFNKLLVDEE